MGNNSMMMFEEEQRQIQDLCDTLARAANALAVLCIDKNGQEIARAGTTEHLDVTSLSSLFAGNVAATGGIAKLLAEKEFTAGSYVPVAAFEIGGKEKRDPDDVCKPRIVHSNWSGCPARVWHRIKIALTPRHPAHYAAVMVNAATPQSLNVRPGEAPPLKQIDEAQPLYTVIMERDLGSKRVPSANICIGSGIIFFTLAWRLHKRDKQEMAVRAAYAK